MTRSLKALLCASVCFALMLPLNSFAQKGSGGGGTGSGGGGTTTPLVFGGGLQALTVGSDQPAFVMLQATSDGRDAPIITKVAGPVGLILYNTAPVDHPHGVNGYNVTYYVWTPSRADIGTSPIAIFTATTASGAISTISVTLGPVQDVAPGAISGLIANFVGDHIEAHWNASTGPDPLTYVVTACYHSVLVGTNLPYLYCNKVDTTNALQSLNIPTGPVSNVGQPGVPATYYGLFVGASSAINSQFGGQVTANVQ